MTPYQVEMCENLRRIAKRGKELAERRALQTGEPDQGHGDYVNVFVHLLDEIQRLKDSK